MQDLILREKEEAFTTSVIITQMYAKYPLNHRQIIITTEKLLDSVRYDGEHNDQISAFEGDILLNGVKNVPKDSKYGIGFSLKDSLSGAIFRKKTYSTKAGNTYIVWEYNRAAFMLITMQLSRYKKALLNQRLFIMGFDLMEERIRLTKVYIEANYRLVIQKRNSFDRRNEQFIEKSESPFTKQIYLRINRLYSGSRIYRRYKKILISNPYGSFYRNSLDS
jgi:phage regulator Rha-like protein